MTTTPTSTSTDGGGAAPVGGGGPPGGIPGLDVAQRQLNRVMDRLREMTQSMDGALEGIGKALRNLGGGADQAPGFVFDPELVSQAMDVAVRLPEVLG